MRFLLTRAAAVLPALWVLTMPPTVFAQGRMGMMMGRQQMAMNAGMMGQFNPNFMPNLGLGTNWWMNSLYGRGLGYGGYGSGGYGGYGGYGYGGYGGDYSGYSSQNPSDYSGYSNDSYAASNRKKRYSSDEYAQPSLQEERERMHQMELAWSQSGLSESETQTGTALNILLADLRELLARGIVAPDMTLDPESLEHINVYQGRHNGNLGILKNNAPLTWPVALRGPESQSDRDLLNSLTPRVIHQVKEGAVPDVTPLTSALQRMQDRLSVKIGDMSTPEYIRAKRFLTQLNDAVKLLGEPDAGNYFNQVYAARGKTVAELVRHMAAKDLHFAPAGEGNAAAYHELHVILAAYDRAARGQLVAKN